MSNTAAVAERVGTAGSINEAASVGTASQFKVSKEDTLQWGRFELHRIVVLGGDARMLEAAILGLESVGQLEARDLDLQGFVQGVFVVGDPEDAQPLVYGYNVAIGLFLQGCGEMFAKRDGKGDGQFSQGSDARPRNLQQELQSQNKVYCWNVDADFEGVQVRSSAGDGLFQAVNHQDEVFAEGSREFCEAYIHTVKDIRGFRNAMERFKKDSSNSGKEPWMNRSILDMAKRILQATSPKGDFPELVSFREMPVVKVAVELAKAALEHGRIARGVQEKAEKEARQAAWKEADDYLSQVEYAVYQQQVKYSRARELQDLIRLATPLVNKFGFKDLAGRIEEVVRPRVGTPVRDSTLAASSEPVSAVPAIA